MRLTRLQESYGIPPPQLFQEQNEWSITAQTVGAEVATKGMKSFKPIIPRANKPRRGGWLASRKTKMKTKQRN